MDEKKEKRRRGERRGKRDEEEQEECQYKRTRVVAPLWCLFSNICLAVNHLPFPSSHSNSPPLDNRIHCSAIHRHTRFPARPRKLADCSSLFPLVALLTGEIAATHGLHPHRRLGVLFSG